MDEKVRMDKLFNDVISEEKSKLDNLEMQGKKFNHHVNHIQQRIFEVSKRVCEKEFKWIEENGKIVADENGLKAILTENTSSLADAVLGEYSSCVDRIDHGMKDFLEGVNFKMNTVHDNSQRCLTSCGVNLTDKSDIDVKVCIKNCFTGSFHDINKIYTSIEGKIREVENKL